MLTQASPHVAPLVKIALAAAEKLDVGVATDVTESLCSFEHIHGSTDLLDALMERHEKVQAAKAKRSWFEAYAEDWLVRGPYQSQRVVPEGSWSHPMRLRTLVQFLQETS
jgi:hypothetical protein